MDFEVVDNCPVPRKLAHEVRALKAETGAVLNSCDRSSDAEPLLRRFGKHSQRELYQNFLRDPAHWNPANPPGFSTHERRNDGKAYPGTRGARLSYWQVGMDWSDPSKIIRAAAKRGWIVTTTYPDSAREVQHVNFRKDPEHDIVLRRGSSGREVEKLTRALARITSPKDAEPYLERAQSRYDKVVEAAVTRFQRDFRQCVDGVYGPQTATQLAVTLREQKEREERLYKRGDGGPEVKRLTKALATLESEDGESYLKQARARYDQVVEAAVRRFQADHKLKADGIFGPMTRKQLYRALDKAKDPKKS